MLRKALMRKPLRRKALMRKPQRRMPLRRTLMPMLNVSSPPPSMTASVTSVRPTAATLRKRRMLRAHLITKSNWLNSLKTLLDVTKQTTLMPTATECTLV